MSSRKAVVLWIAVAVILSVSLGTIIASEATADKHAPFQLNGVEFNDESTLEGGPVAVMSTDNLTNTDDLTGPQTVAPTDVFEGLENYETPSVDDTVGAFLVQSGSESEDDDEREDDEEDDDEREDDEEDDDEREDDEEDDDEREDDEEDDDEREDDENEEESGDTESERATDPESKPDQKRKSRPDSSSESKPQKSEDNSESPSKSKSESKSEPDPKPESESKSEPDPKPESESKSEPDPKPESESESPSESQPEESTDDTESAPVSEPEPESEPDPDPEPASELASDPERDSNDAESSLRGSESVTSSGPESGDSDSAEPTVTRTETDDTVTIHVDDANGETIVQPLDLAGPSETDPVISLSTLEIDPANREVFEMTVARPTSDPGGLLAVPHGEALGYVDLETDLDANGTTTLSFGLDRAAISDGLGTENVEVLQYTDGEWTAAGVTHDVSEEDHRVALSEASSVAIVALEPGSIEVVEADVPADWVRVGHETRARATVRNAGDRPETDTLAITMDGETVAERTVSLGPDETATIDLAFEPTGNGAVALDGSEIGTIAVRENYGSNAGGPETTEEMPGFGLVSIVLALSVVVLAARIRHWATSRRS